MFSYDFPIISCLKFMVNSYFHLFRRKSLPTNDFELTVPDLYEVNEQSTSQETLSDGLTTKLLLKIYKSWMTMYTTIISPEQQ